MHITHDGILESGAMKVPNALMCKREKPRAAMFELIICKQSLWLILFTLVPQCPAFHLVLA